MREKHNKWKRILTSIVLLAFIGISTYIPVKAEESHPPLIVDDASLLSSSEVAELEERLSIVSDKHNIDVVIVTVYDSMITSAMAEADDYFDYNGFGRGTDRSGLVLYINMSTRDWWISTRGYAIYAFTDAGIQYIGERILDDLSGGFYYDAFSTYIDLCDDFLTQAENGSPYDVNHMPKARFSFFACFGTSLLIACVAALIYIIILKSQLKSVAPNNRAADYVVDGSMKITESRETFLYKNVTSVRKAESSSSSGGGSRTHTSSSGASHGGGGGKF